jgi:predicted transposase YbfD/YdcC
MPSTLLSIFETIDDPRTGNRTVHNLAEVVTLCLLAVISGCNRISEIHFFLEDHLDRLKQFLPLEHGLLSLSQLYKILAMIRPAALQQALIAFHNHLADELGNGGFDGLDLVAIDGKVLRGAIEHANRSTPMTVLNAYSSLYGTVIGQLDIPEKTNEITSIRQFVTLIDVRGRLVTADATHCQRQTAQAILDEQADYLLTLKRNQKTLFEDVELYFQDKEAEIASTAITTDGGHGRIEVRTCRTTTEIAWFQALHHWPGLACIAEVVNETTSKRTGKTTVEKRLLLCSRSAPSSFLLEASRLHWHVENKVHYIIDVTFGEDACRLVSDHAQANLAVLRRMALNVVKTYKQQTKSKFSMNLLRQRIGRKSDLLGKVLAMCGMSLMSADVDQKS